MSLPSPRSAFRLALSLFALAAVAIPPAHAQRSIPIVHGGGHRIAAGPVEITVAPTRGARIRSLKYEETEMLYQDSSGTSPTSHGSTFWVSPQAHWTATCRSAGNNGCWPPPAQHDGSGTGSAYTGGIVEADSTVTYTGPAHTYTGVRIRKTFWGNPHDSSVTIRYHLVNTLTTGIAFAPWEVTRFVSGGLAFYAKTDQDTIRGNGAAGTAMINMITDTLGVKWHRYDSATVPTSGTAKFWDATSEGWFARVDKSRLLYIKKFEVIPPSKKAPVHENQIEFYASNRSGATGGMALVEMELQGAFDSIAPGDSLAWEVKWFVRRLPDSIPVTRNSALLSLVRQTVAGNVTGIRGGALPDPRSLVSLSSAGDRISLFVRAPSVLSLVLVDASGSVVQRLHSGRLESGAHAFGLEAVPRGTYWLVVRGADAKVLATRAVPRL